MWHELENWINFTTEEVFYILLNVYLHCNYSTIETLIEYKENMAKISETIATEEYDEVIIQVNLIVGNPNKGRFFYFAHLPK